MRWLAIAALTLLCACGPNIGRLEKGERGTVTRVVNGDTLELDSGLRVFLAEIEAPRRDAPYAAQARQELESLALHRPVQLAYGGAHRWMGRRNFGAQGATTTNTATSTAPAYDDRDAQQSGGEIAIAHIYVQSEGGRWIWLQQEMVSRGAAYVRTRRENHARASELLVTEAQARAAHRGLWTLRDYSMLSPAQAVTIAQETAPAPCRNGRFAFVEGTIGHADVQDRRASLDFSGAPFSIAIFGQTFSNWDGPPLASLQGKRVRARGTIGMFHDAAQMCVDQGAELEVLAPAAH